MNSTTQHLVEKYGPLLTLTELADILDRSREGLRLTLRGNSELARQLGAARLKIGRRVHFKTAVVASVIDGPQLDPNSPHAGRV
jgi:hypothetical protein